MMGESDTQRLQKINSQLIDLYLRLNEPSLTLDEEQSVLSSIYTLETEKNELPNNLLLDNKIQQYVIILRSAASTLQLQRQTEHQFSDDMDLKPAPDAIRQRNINFNKRQSIEKKIETYRQKLSEMGLRTFELDNIVLEGYREQNQRFSQKILKSLELAIADYLEEHYQNVGHLPEDVFALIQSWGDPKKRDELTYSQLRVLELKENCLRKGIPLVEIEQRIRANTQWDEQKKQAQLRSLKSKVQQEVAILEADVNIMTEIKAWTQLSQVGTHLKPTQANILLLINEMKMHGVQQDAIDAVLKSFSPNNEGFFASIKSRLRRHSKDEG